MTASVTGDTEPFAKIPEWLLFHPDLSGDAVRIYGVLARCGKCIKPSRRRIAEQAHCSIRTVDKCLAQLVQVGAIRITRRIGEKGDLTSSEYTLRTTAPATPSAESALPLVQTMHHPSAENDTTPSAKNDTTLVQILHSKESSSNESNLNEQVTPTSLPVARARKRDIHWDAMVDVWGYSPSRKTPDHRKWNEAVGIWRAIDATADDIHHAAALYVAEFPTMAFTPLAVAGHAERLLRGRKPTPTPQLSDIKSSSMRTLMTMREEDFDDDDSAASIPAQNGRSDFVPAAPRRIGRGDEAPQRHVLPAPAKPRAG